MMAARSASETMTKTKLDKSTQTMSAKVETSRYYGAGQGLYNMVLTTTPGDVTGMRAEHGRTVPTAGEGARVNHDNACGDKGTV